MYYFLEYVIRYICSFCIRDVLFINYNKIFFLEIKKGVFFVKDVYVYILNYNRKMLYLLY